MRTCPEVWQIQSLPGCSGVVVHHTLHAVSVCAAVTVAGSSITDRNLTIFGSVVYVLNLGFALYAMWPNPMNDVDEDDEDRESTSSDPKERSTWEMQSMKSPVSMRESPFTPRTQAFHTLDRQLPLRQQKQGQQYA